MKRFSKFVLLVVLSFGMFAPVWGQASTEGKRFWVALPYANGPSGLKLPEPFIAISAQKACDVTISQPAGSWSISLSVKNNSWTVLSNGDPDGSGREATIATPGTPAIPNEVWYNTGWNANTASEPTAPFPYALLVESTEDISLFAAMRGVASYDATNVLPEPTLQSEYIIQDYAAYNPDGDAHSLFVIVAITDNTVIDVKLPDHVSTLKGKTGSFQVTLNKGQTYQVLSQDKGTLSGTHITAHNKLDASIAAPIAVFSGADFTQIPGGQSARDCLYEQAMPVDYWGTQFVVTRSLDKAANRIRITAQEPDTWIAIDGDTLSFELAAGETYEFEMSENLATTDMASKITGAGRTIPDVYTGDAHYIETSCPVAVFNYDVSSGYVHSGTSDKKGDPSMVWVSPLEQRISKITFGACGTIKCRSCSDACWTNKHYVNIVCLTSDIENVKLSSEKRTDIATSFTPVPGNPDYSYARVFLVDTDDSSADKVFTLSNTSGFIASVYGSGKNESYAYSAGSAAVKRSVSIVTPTGTTSFIDDDDHTSTVIHTFCLGDTLTFRPNVAGNAVSRVIWDFDDGVTKDTTRFEEGAILEAKHVYTSPGWYDAEAIIFGAEFCNHPAFTDTVNFRFKVTKSDTIPFVITLCADSVATFHFPLVENTKTYSMADPTEDEVIRDTLSSTETCPTTYLLTIYAIGKKEVTIDLDTVYSVADRRDGAWIPANGPGVAGDEPHPSAEWISPAGADTTCTRWYHRADTDCDSVVHYHVTILKCLDLQINNNPDEQYACMGEQLRLPISYDPHGKPGEAYFVISEVKKVPITLNEATFDGTRMRDTVLLPTEAWEPGYYTGMIEMEDVYCEQTLYSPLLNLTVYYPQSIFAYKFNNVLAVYTKGSEHNPNYEFSAYQWYRNGVAIEGATSSVYHSDTPFTPGDSYYVLLTDKDNMTVPACDFTVPEVIEDYTPKSNAPAASKKLINRHMYIEIEDRMYDVYGQRVK